MRALPATTEFVDADGLPQRFGKYTLIRKLATGGMAELFLAIQRSVAGFEKLIVIKRILPSMNQDRAFIEMLLQEARVAATLSHPNIVQVFDVGQVDGVYFIAMEHVHGEDLRSIVRQMRHMGVSEFPFEHAISIVLGTCAGLSYAHEKRDLDGTALNIVHRDISPQNIIVTFTGDVKIVDFGIAKSDTTIVDDTKSGKLKGKVPYMSPEQARGEELDGRSDLFATGVLLFELTTGKRLFKGQSDYETLKLICDREYPRPSEVRRGYPHALEAIVMKALAKDRNQRFQTAREMRGALEEYVRTSRIGSSAVALTQFMEGLFAEKIAAQKQSLQEGKHLADIIEQQRGPDSELDLEPSARVATLSTPAASRTLTDTPARRSRVALGLLAAASIIGAGGYYARAYLPRSGAHVEGAAINAAKISDSGSIVVTSDPAGATIWIDGDPRALVTPATVAKLPVGKSIDVSLTKEGYVPVTRALTLSEAAPKGEMHAALVKGMVAIEIAAPSNAKLTMKLDGKPVTGAKLEGVSAGDQHTLVVDSTGYASQSFVFIGSPFETKKFEVVLEKEHGAHHTHEHRSLASPVVATPTPPTANAPPPAVALPSNATTSLAAGASIENAALLPPPPPEAVSGKLDVGAKGGSCDLLVDALPRGVTPVQGMELSTGSHILACTTPDGKTVTANVYVAGDTTTRYRFILDQ